MPRRPSLSILALLAIAIAQEGHAGDTLLDAVDSQVDSNRASLSAERNIDQVNEQTRQMLEQYRQALRQSEALNSYNAQLRRLVSAQEAEKQSLEMQLGAIDLTRRDIVPLMLRMLDTLDRFVQADKPFLTEERSQRVADLKALMNRADVGDAEKFRRLLEAYQVENDYGKVVEAYRAQLDVGQKPRTVDFLRFGRLALVYRSLDGKETGAWNSKTKRWETLPPEYGESVRLALAVARRETVPELLPIAVESPEALP